MDFKEIIYWIGQLVGIILFILISQYLGAGVRWVLKIGKRPYNDIIEDSPMWNSLIAILLTAGILLLYDYMVGHIKS